MERKSCAHQHQTQNIALMQVVLRERAQNYENCSAKMYFSHRVVARTHMITPDTNCKRVQHNVCMCALALSRCSNVWCVEKHKSRSNTKATNIIHFTCYSHFAVAARITQNLLKCDQSANFHLLFLLIIFFLSLSLALYGVSMCGERW